MRVAVLGGGVMGETLASGFLRYLTPAPDVVIAEKRPERAEELRRLHGVEIADTADAVRGADVVLLAVKPQDVPALLAGSGDASFATHDARLIEILESLVGRYGRIRHSYEFALFMGRQEGAQERLLEAGERVRVYVPYGPDWFERLVGGLAEQPGTITAALRSLLPGAS